MTKRPNILLFMVDEQRYPTVYDGPVLREWMKTKLVAQTLLRENGVEFHRHYAQSTACAPSRTSLFTGQYPTLHGVSQTDGMGKTAWDPGMSWLDPNTVPTMGDWFRAAGYQTHYRGKWHISHADILVPGTKDSLMTTRDNGTPILENVDIYRAADRLDDFGFSGWIGPEPHGANKANSGWIRDPRYRDETVALLDALETSDDDRPFLLVNSFVNPHDIVFFGLTWNVLFGLEYPQAGILPPPPPTHDEDLCTKPRAQASYVEQYGKMFLPQPQIEMYYRFYYYLQEQVDRYVLDVYNKLQGSRFANDTIIVFTSDHGDMLGAHGGMHQKWYQAYEETIHVPMIFSGPLVTDKARDEYALTSHADLTPTLLGLAGVDVERASQQLALSHCETRPLVGRDLSKLVLGKGHVEPEPIFFMTYDNVSQGLSQVVGRRQWEAVDSPNQVETVIVEHKGSLWKYSRYAQCLPTPYDGLIANQNAQAPIDAYNDVEPEYEMYKLLGDETEITNLCYPGNETAESIAMRPYLQQLLDEQRRQKCLHPRTKGEKRAGGEGLSHADVPAFAPGPDGRSDAMIQP
ncbi:MAG TPA: sulfatase-like hydrolase/transferase [Thermoanaerobaculia bacterium]|nr:sulfatase-like hydrolase/transferase [Thermoanaerobaculia bacterium]